jgi:hypothetical protein
MKRRELLACRQHAATAEWHCLGMQGGISWETRATHPMTDEAAAITLAMWCAQSRLHACHCMHCPTARHRGHRVYSMLKPMPALVLAAMQSGVLAIPACAEDDRKQERVWHE